MADYVLMRAADRFLTDEPGLTSRHSFSFGRHYDPGNVGFGLLVMNNDDVIRPGAGYPTHPHRDVEIVTWVLEGALAHRDSTGAGGVIHPGLAQRLSAGRGVQHAEFNDDEPRGERRRAVRAGGGESAGDSLVRPDKSAAADADGGPGVLRFVQMWVPPDEWGVDPSYEQRDVSGALTQGSLVTVVSGMHRHTGTAAIGLGQRAAAMHVGRLPTVDAGQVDDDRAASGDEDVRAGSRGGGLKDDRGSGPSVGGLSGDGGSTRSPDGAQSLTLPTAPFVHVYVTRGAVDVEGIGRLGEGDAVRITDEGGRYVTAVPALDHTVSGDQPAAGGRVVGTGRMRGTGQGRGIGQGHGTGQAVDQVAELIVWEMHAYAAGANASRFIT